MLVISSVFIIAIFTMLVLRQDHILAGAVAAFGIIASAVFWNIKRKWQSKLDTEFTKSQRKLEGIQKQLENN